MQNSIDIDVLQRAVKVPTYKISIDDVCKALLFKKRVYELAKKLEQKFINEWTIIER